jgi:hypothetical protein
MASLSAREAAQLVGMTKQGIIKSIRKGTISAEKDASGEWRIAASELLRVYPAAPKVDDNQPPTGADGDGVSLRREIVFRDEKIAMLEGQLADLRGERDRLLGIVETQAARLLTDQRPPPQPDVRRGWWRRLRGK